MTAFTWLHLSDLHIRGDEFSVHREDFSKMLDDIRARCAEECLKPDAVFLTGDVAFSGQKEQYDLAKESLDRILEACNLPGQRQKLFVVPGNHDIDRMAVMKPKFVYDQHMAFAQGLLDPDRPYKEIDDFLGDEEHKKWAFRKLNNFARFLDEFFGSSGDACDHNQYYSVRAVELGGHPVVVLGFNSAWLSFRDNEQGQLLLGARQVCDALEMARRRWPNAALHVAMVHHPLYWMAEKDIHEIQKYLPQRCGILLRGHLHCSSFSIQSTPDSHLHEFAAGASLWADYQAYNLVKLDLDTGKLTALVRLHDPKIGPEWGNDSFTYRNAKNGKIELRLKPDVSKSPLEE